MAHEEQHTSPSQEPEGKPSAREGKEGNRLKIISLLFFAFFLLLWLLLYFLNKELIRGGAPEAGFSMFVVVDIEPGCSVGDIATKLAAENLISNELMFKVAATLRGTTRGLKAGEYRLERSMSLLEILARLEQGHVMLRRFTIPEGSTVTQIARILSEKGLAQMEEIISLANDPYFCEELEIKASTLEGYLFPETYKVAKGLTARQVLHIMVDRFWHVWRAEINGRPDAENIDIGTIISIASIIEKEAIYNNEKFLISSVIYNRLKNNMRLQCDVTIRYPLDNYGIELTYEDLRLDSPYNSYLHKGLPPTPICSPGTVAIRAALNPPDTDYLYFVSMNNGHHKFSSSLREHNDAVFKYRVLQERGEDEQS